jgi:hypothetical protein
LLLVVDFSKPVPNLDDTILGTSSALAHDGIINGNLTTAGTTKHRFSMGGGASDSKLVVNGNVSLSGTAIPIGSLAAGTHTLMTYTGTRTGTFGAAIVGQPGSTITYDDGNKQILATLNSPIYYNLNTNIDGASWSNAGYWEASVPPNPDLTDTIAVTTTSASAPRITLDQNVTLNHLDLSQTGNPSFSYNGVSKFTFDGVSPTISGSKGATIDPGIILNSDLSFTGLGTFNFTGPITSNNHSFYQTAKSVLIIGNSFTGTGGSYNLQGGKLTLGNSTSLGTSTGPTIILSNAGSLAPNLTNNSAVTTPNNISFSDIGSNNFTVSGGSSAGYSGNFSGSLSHDLYLSGLFSGVWSVSGSFNINVEPTTGTLKISTATFPSSNKIVMGTGLTYSVGQTIVNNISLTNNIDIIGYSSGAGAWSQLSSAGTGTYSGNIVINSNQSSLAGQTLYLSNSGAKLTISGVISNSATGASNFTVTGNSGQVVFTGANTYTSPTTLVGGEFCVNGSISSSSLVTVGANGGLSGKGTVGPVTMTSNGLLYSYSHSNSPTTSDILTINGNLTMGTRTGTLTAPSGYTITYDDTAGAGRVILTK